MIQKEKEIFNEIVGLRTELNNLRTVDIDILPTLDMLKLINDEDKTVALAVEQELHNIAVAVDIIATQFRLGGRLFYLGAGTSGRLGIVDASECPPTFGTDPQMVQGIIAGGTPAIFRAQEGVEDSFELGAKEIANHNVSSIDVVCGIAASGRTPFVRGAIAEANRIGAKTIFVSTSSADHLRELGIETDAFICPDVGPEVIAGSTRMKSGTAQKLVLNMLTTGAMIKLGKTFGNVMVDLQPTNAKLKERSKKIIMNFTGLSYEEAAALLIEAGWHVKTALVMSLGNVSKEKARHLLDSNDGFIKKALKQNQNSNKL